MAHVSAHTPTGSLAVSGSILYGTTGFGGTNGLGNVFRINTDGSGFENLLSFGTAERSTAWHYDAQRFNALRNNWRRRCR